MYSKYIFRTAREFKSAFGRFHLLNNILLASFDFFITICNIVIVHLKCITYLARMLDNNYEITIFIFILCIVQIGGMVYLSINILFAVSKLVLKFPVKGRQISSLNSRLYCCATIKIEHANHWFYIILR